MCSHDKVPNWPLIVFFSSFLSSSVSFFKQLFNCFCGKIFCWKYSYREMILYIVIYKCVQRRKYINGFSQWGSMHELFLKMMTGGKDTVSVNARFPNLIKSYWSTLHILLLVLPHRRKNITENLVVTQQILFTSQHPCIEKRNRC